MKPYDSTESKKEQIRTMFNRIAPSYDMLNHLLSLGVDRCWRARVVTLVARERPQRVLDMATGTADMAIALSRKMPDARITGADLSAQMLEVGRVKIAGRGLESRIDLIETEAEQMPFADMSFDVATVAFGVRNFHELQRGLEQLQRVLKVGGKLYVLEFSTPRNKIFGTLYRFYFHRVLPTVGGWLSKDKQAYRYLPDSVDEFPSVEHFEQMMGRAGFVNCKSIALMTGVAYIYIGEKV